MDNDLRLPESLKRLCKVRRAVILLEIDDYTRVPRARFLGNRLDGLGASRAKGDGGAFGC